MRLLVLGGTAFIGRRLVEAALEGSHEVTIFTRGRTNPDLFPGVEHLVGDREADLSPLEGRSFDVAIDTCGYVPRVVRASATLLAGAVERYVFISSISVYAESAVLTESTPVQEAPEPESEDIGSHYGPLKALCENEVTAAFPARALVIRPGLVVGRDDYTGRFSYWPRRVAEGGEVLAPGSPGTRIWLIDARDLAEWTIRLVEDRTTGVFNATGPVEPLTLGALLDECKAISRSDARFVWAPDDFLLGHGVAPYIELPLWVPGLDGGYPEVDVSRAVAAGLTFRPIGDTIRDVLVGEGFDARTAGSFGLPRRPAGLDPGRETELLVDLARTTAPVPQALE
ncbi:MAG TPA: NAD-dependent epimerase/dehydratase family protein [Gaiellaceae bacterium]|nr:NAD-dependent epimerase/dehydratase family protein [Gaiellaceae bacterium]